MATKPDELGLPYEDVWLSVTNKQGVEENLHAWWLPNQSRGDVMLYLHGNASNISHNLELAQKFYQLGFSLLLLDYRGYGLSSGKFPTEAQVYQDTQVAWDYLVQQKGLKPEQIFVYGHSLGGAIAVDLGLRQPQIAGLIIQGSFTSILDIVIHYGGIYRFFPTKVIINQRFDSLSKVPLLKMPLLFIHGSKDEVIPLAMSEKLFAAAKSPKQLLIVPEAGHDDVSGIGGEKYLESIQDFTQSARSLTLNK
ncbi:alpha/beta hydrolase [Gloeocapsa sp. PCC 73106]|uniref:alpha/beta hydrolase n=1 Tax=Gloeocapsa sp. PCC 73106 TaxID=102232 RepID=UPI001EE666DC|nr:alpha/beta fold hydrolase [Gloeocapsa sp. PCC 73106]